MKTVTQLRAHIANTANATGVKADVLYRNYMFERLLKRLSLSKYRDHFVLKGGLLIAYLVGFESRGTMDLDGTICGFPVNEKNLEEMLKDITEISVDDSITFEMKSIKQIIVERDYECLRVSMTAHFEEMKIPLKLDISTGDAITPRPIEFRHRLMFSGEQIEILAYNLETVLAEKIESIISRNITGTRMRDYYDVHILTKLRKDEIDINLLKKALHATSERRNTLKVIENASQIMIDIKTSEELQKLWQSYTEIYEYAKDISWEEIFISLEKIMSELKGD